MSAHDAKKPGENDDAAELPEAPRDGIQKAEGGEIALCADAHGSFLAMGLMVRCELNFAAIDTRPTSVSGLFRGSGPAHIGIALEAGERIGDSGNTIYLVTVRARCATPAPFHGVPWLPMWSLSALSKRYWGQWGC